MFNEFHDSDFSFDLNTGIINVAATKVFDTHFHQYWFGQSFAIDDLDRHFLAG